MKHLIKATCPVCRKEQQIAIDTKESSSRGSCQHFVDWQLKGKKAIVQWNNNGHYEWLDAVKVY